jgi:hypothetical protein
MMFQPILTVDPKNTRTISDVVNSREPLFVSTVSADLVWQAVSVLDILRPCQYAATAARRYRKSMGRRSIRRSHRLLRGCTSGTSAVEVVAGAG